MKKLENIVNEFKKNRENILGQNYKTNGLEMVLIYSKLIEKTLISLFDLTINCLPEYDNQVALFSYGSIGRKEMICESDLDILLVYKEDDLRSKNLKKKFKEILKPLEFCKIDLPNWGTLEDLRIFAERSITEGNQVLECRFIKGSKNIEEKVKEIQEEYCTVDRMIRNIIFQKFYFDQYFKQRIRNGAINVKYCDGGSRDFLFIFWFDILMNKLNPNWNKTYKDLPVTEAGIKNLYENGLLNYSEFKKCIEALNFCILLRNEILLINKGTEDEGLTFLDNKTLEGLFKYSPNLMRSYNINSPSGIKEKFEEYRSNIRRVKEKIWYLTIEELSKRMNQKNWKSNFIKAYDIKTSEKERYQIFLDQRDIFTKIAVIWGLQILGKGACSIS